MHFSTSDSAKLSIIADPDSIFDLYHYANIFIRVCISKHGCTSIGTNLCITALLLIRVLVFV